MSHVEDRVIDAVRAARAETLRSVIVVLERGGNIGECFDGTGIGHTEPSDRLRAIRDDLVELDVYRLLYGPLPTFPPEPTGMDAWRGPATTVIGTRLNEAPSGNITIKTPFKAVATGDWNADTWTAGSLS